MDNIHKQILNFYFVMYFKIEENFNIPFYEEVTIAGFKYKCMQRHLGAVNGMVATKVNLQSVLSIFRDPCI